MTALGIILVLTGAALMVAEAHLPSHGALGASAVVALPAGVVLALSGTGMAGGAVARRRALARSHVGTRARRWPRGAPWSPSRSTASP
jgi:membrane-bound ClpP family serine protease